MINFNGDTHIRQINNYMTPGQFNQAKGKESKESRLQVRVEPFVEDMLRQINREFYPDLDFPTFHRSILYMYIRKHLNGRERE